jgi:hypothetical protein
MRPGRLCIQVMLFNGFFASAASAQQSCLPLISESDRLALEHFLKNFQTTSAILKGIGENYRPARILGTTTKIAGDILSIGEKYYFPRAERLLVCHSPDGEATVMPMPPSEEPAAGLQFPPPPPSRR